MVEKLESFREINLLVGIPVGSAVNNSPANAGDVGSIPELGRSPGEGDGNLLRYSCLGNPMTEEPGRLQSTGLQKSQTRLSN